MDIPRGMKCSSYVMPFSTVRYFFPWSVMLWSERSQASWITIMWLRRLPRFGRQIFRGRITTVFLDLEVRKVTSTVVYIELAMSNYLVPGGFEPQNYDPSESPTVLNVQTQSEVDALYSYSLSRSFVVFILQLFCRSKYRADVKPSRFCRKDEVLRTPCLLSL